MSRRLVLGCARVTTPARRWAIASYDPTAPFVDHIANSAELRRQGAAPDNSAQSAAVTVAASPNEVVVNAGALGLFTLTLASHRFTVMSQHSGLVRVCAELCGGVCVQSVMRGLQTLSSSDVGSFMISVTSSTSEGHRRTVYANLNGVQMQCHVAFPKAAAGSDSGVARTYLQAPCAPAAFGPAAEGVFSVSAELLEAWPRDACTALEDPAGTAPADDAATSGEEASPLRAFPRLVHPAPLPPEAAALSAYRDRVVLVRRGNCMFEQKLRHVAAAGGLGAIVVDHEGSDGPFMMSAGDGGGGDEAASLKRVVERVHMNCDPTAAAAARANASGPPPVVHGVMVSHAVGVQLSRLSGGTAVTFGTVAAWSPRAFGATPAGHARVPPVNVSAPSLPPRAAIRLRAVVTRGHFVDVHYSRRQLVVHAHAKWAVTLQHGSSGIISISNSWLRAVNESAADWQRERAVEAQSSPAQQYVHAMSAMCGAHGDAEAAPGHA